MDGPTTLGQEFLDEKELPFSEAEFYQAFLMAGPDEQAREAASTIASLVREASHMNAMAAEARRQGSTDRGKTNETLWVIDPLHFAMLTLVSDDLRARVNRYWRAYWESQRPGLTQAALHRRGMSILAQPTAEVIAEVESQMEAYEEEWRSTCEEARTLVEQWTIR